MGEDMEVEVSVVEVVAEEDLVVGEGAVVV